MRLVVMPWGRKKVVCGAIVAVFGLGWVACDTRSEAPPSSDVGTVQLSLSFPPGEMVNTVIYTLKQPVDGKLKSVSGFVNIPIHVDPVTLPDSVSVGLGVPVGSGYVVEMTASIQKTALNGQKSDTGRMCSGMSDPFSISANQLTTSVTVFMTCPASATPPAMVNVKGTLDNCPAIVGAAASSLVVSMGGTIDLSAVGIDVDGDGVGYSWTADGGTFDSPAAPATKYHCPAAAGLQTITLTVSDYMGAAPTVGAGGAGGSGTSGAAGPAKCMTAAQVVVNCGLCGNGAVDTSAGEQCDPPNGITCDSVCQTTSAGGAGGARGTGGAGGAPGAGGAGGAHGAGGAGGAG